MTREAHVSKIQNKCGKNSLRSSSAIKNAQDYVGKGKRVDNTSEAT